MFKVGDRVMHTTQGIATIITIDAGGSCVIQLDNKQSGWTSRSFTEDGSVQDGYWNTSIRSLKELLNDTQEPLVIFDKEI